MGKGKVVVLHLLAVAAGWGMVAALRPLVAAGPAERQAAAEGREPGKTPRTRSPSDIADVAGGQELLQRLTDARPEDPAASDPFWPYSFAELVARYRRKAQFDPDAPAPPRVDEGRSPEENAAAAAYHELLGNLLAGHLKGEAGHDVSHAFRHGRLEAQAIYDSMAPHLPGATADDTLRIALYRQLAPLDPDRAEVLLEPLPDPHATVVKYEAFMASASEFTPDSAFALLSSIPPPDDFYGRLRRFQAWASVTENLHLQYGSDYLHWLEQLPSGVDRDFAAAAVAERLPTDDLASYQRLRALITGSYPLEGPLSR
jgi:hypothetical protein